MRLFRPCFLLAVLSLALASAAAQQPSSSPMEASRIDETRLTRLSGSVHPLAQAKYDHGAVEPGFRATRLLLTLARPAEREQALRQFLANAHSPASNALQ